MESPFQFASPQPPSPAPLVPAVRRRGGQPGNRNARAHGLFSEISPSPGSIVLADLQHLQRLLRLPSLPHQHLLSLAVEQRDRLEALLDSTVDPREILALLEIRFRVSSSINRILKQIALVARPYHRLLQEALSPLEFIRSGFVFRGIVRDADSFFAVLEKSTLNSPAPPAPLLVDGQDLPADLQPFTLLDQCSPSAPESAGDPCELLASSRFSLTDEQWSILAPLIPPDPDLEHMHGDPPPLILFNRWCFSSGSPGPLEAFSALKEYRRLTPACVYKGQAQSSRRGRPYGDPRALLEAIFWKLSTGLGWSELPPGYPSWRICQLYYRRLFKSGRLYTLLLALYEDLRSRSQIDPASLVESAALTLGERDRVIPASGLELTWENQTALLFLQVAHSTHRRVDRAKTQR